MPAASLMRRNAIATIVLLVGIAAAGCGHKPGDDNSSREKQTMWTPDPKVLAELSDKKTAWVYRESDVPEFRLPDALLCADGKRVESAGAWEERRRPETLALFERHVYGKSPRPESVKFEVLETDARSLDGAATRRKVRITSFAGGRSFAFEASVVVPNNAPGPVPAFLFINNRDPADADAASTKPSDFWPVSEMIRRGYAAATFHTADVDPDADGPEARAAGVRSALAGPGREGRDAWGSLAAWAWGAGRLLDYLETVPAVNAKHVAVIGHSRGGKAALWAGAADARFALVVSNDSGCGGAALSRRRFGETVEIINKKFPYWFCGNFTGYNGREDQLPVDQHQLLAMIAPRPLYVASADEDLWADPRGEFLSLVHAGEVYRLYGQPELFEPMPPLNTPVIRGRVAYHIRSGKHDLTLRDWNWYMDFADRQWKSASATTSAPDGK